MKTGLDPRLTFETFVVGAANRLASAAAARVAEAPGSGYNPLVLYGASGLGKTHLVMAIGNRITKLNPELNVRYAALEQFFDGDHPIADFGSLKEQVKGVDILLLDDVQFLAERVQAQEELLLAWDAIVTAGGQIVLASDRAPNEIEKLDRRLTSRIFGGLVADVAPPEYETRVEIARRRAAERGQTLAEGVADQLARLAFGNVRELQGGLNRVLAAQELESRPVTADQVARLLGLESATPQPGEFGSYVTELSGTLSEVLERLSPEQQLAEAILRWEGEGYRTTRLDSALLRAPTSLQTERLVTSFAADVARLRVAEAEIRSLDPAAPELARTDLLRNPDAVAQVEALVARVRERLRARAKTDEATAEAHNGANGSGKPNGGRPAPPSSRGTARIPSAESMKRVPGGKTRFGGANGGDAGAAATPGVGIADKWFLSREKVLWDWPYIEDTLVMESE
ncbi:MAG: DnaA ATPase domain-containing protein [Longimicrobiales bacterium]